MASHLTLEAQFNVTASFRFTDPALLTQIYADYPGLSTNAGLLYGVSPVTLVQQYNGFGGAAINLVDNPTADGYNSVPSVFTTSAADPGKVLGTSIDPLVQADGVQTLGSVSYTDANGQDFTSVTWEWVTEIKLYTIGSNDVNTWDQQFVSWTGDGTLARLIPTTFALDTGKVAVWIFPNQGSGHVSSFRHSDMAGTAIPISPISTTGGIMAFQSGGFTVTDSVPGGVRVNTVGELYNALVMKCSDTDAPFMSFGSYAGRGVIATTGNFTAGSRICTIGGLTSADLNRSIIINGSQGNTIAGVNGGIITLGTPSLFNGNNSVTGVGGGQTIGTTNATVKITQLWLFGRSSQCVFWTEDMPSAQSTSFGNEGKNLTDQILSVTTQASLDTGAHNSFVPGDDNNVNSGSLTYYYVAFHIPAAHDIRSQFRTFKITGTGSSVAQTGFGFSPAFAMARRFTALDTAGSAWRGPVQATTHSTRFDAADLASGGVEALGADGVTLGTTIAPLGADAYGFAFKGASNTAFSVSTPTYAFTETFTNPDGTTSSIETLTASETSPGEGFTLVSGVAQWWCNAAFGYSVFQIDSPGTGWVACAGPTDDNGWVFSVNDFGGQATIVSGGVPANPRSWLQIATWATLGTGMLGGSPGAAAATGSNSFVYPAAGYTVGTHYPPLRIFNGRSDKELCRLPPTTGNAIPKAVMSMLAANGTVYLTSWDSGTTSADWAGRVFQLNSETGTLTVLGSAFAAGEMPYALAWHMGRLWCGTNNGIGTVGKVYYFRPGIDTAWTLDYTTSSSTAGGVDSMVSFQGKLYVGTDNIAASRGKVLVRDTAGAYTTSLTGTTGTARVNNGYIQLTVFGTKLYAAYWNNDSPSVAKIEAYDGTSWSTAYTGTSGTIRPFIQLLVDNDFLYAFGGGNLLSGVILSTSNGTLWTDLTAELPESDTTFLPMFGAVVV